MLNATQAANAGYPPAIQKALNFCFLLLIVLFPVSALSTKWGSGVGQFLVMVAAVLALSRFFGLVQGARADQHFVRIDAKLSPLTVFIVAWGVALCLEAFTLVFHQFRASQVHSLVLRLLLVIALLGFIQGSDRNRWFWWSVVCGCFSVFLIAVYQFFIQKLGRATGFHNAIHYGNFSLMLAVFACTALFLLKGLSKAQRYALGFAALAGLAASLLSGSRGGWVAVPFFLALAVFYTNLNRRTLLVLTLAVAMLSVVVFLVPATGVQMRFQAFQSDLTAYFNGNTATSIGARLELMRASWFVFLANPWFGVGEDFLAVLKVAKSFGFPIQAEDRLNDSHHEVLFFLVRGGVPGLIQLLLLYVGPAVYFVSMLKRSGQGSDQAAYAFAGLCLVVGVVIFGLSVNVFTRNIGKAFYFIMVILLVSLCERAGRETPSEK